MIKSCRQCQTSFEITDDDLKFYEKISPVFQEKKYLIPPPTLCPDCRQQRRLVWRNERNLYQRKCDLCRKDIISMYSPSVKNPIYCQHCWWSDAWDALQFSRSISFSQSFLENYTLLKNTVPLIALMNTQGQNSEFCNYAVQCKNCYLLFSTGLSEECFYGKTILTCKNSVDCAFTEKCELCYECVDCESCYHSFFLQNCQNCRDSWFLYDCYNCHHCIASFNLRNKEYCIFNQQYSKEDYLKKYEEFHLHSYKEIKKSQQLFLQKTKKEAIHKHARNVNIEDSSGDYLVSCKDCHSSFNVLDARDCKFVYDAPNNIIDCYDGSYLYLDTNLCYEVCSSTKNNNTFFSIASWNSYNIFYSQYCHFCHDLFGCIGLRHKQYCIFNKQYTKEEYEELVPRIIEHMIKTGEWGEFFPANLSPFGYNETVANEYYPLTKEEAVSKGFNWSDYESPKPDVKKIIPAEKLPDDIKKIPNDILNWAIECEITKKPFRIIKQELEFYRQHNLPIPRRHPDQRHKDRLQLRNPRKLWKRNCMKCNKEIQTTYSPDRKEIVYCEDCYLKEVY